jgi:hypothetical protein
MSETIFRTTGKLTITKKSSIPGCAITTKTNWVRVDLNRTPHTTQGGETYPCRVDVTFYGRREVDSIRVLPDGDEVLEITDAKRNLLFALRSQPNAQGQLELVWRRG